MVIVSMSERFFDNQELASVGVPPASREAQPPCPTGVAAMRPTRLAPPEARDRPPLAEEPLKCYTIPTWECEDNHSYQTVDPLKRSSSPQAAAGAAITTATRLWTH